MWLLMFMMLVNTLVSGVKLFMLLLIALLGVDRFWALFEDALEEATLVIIREEGVQLHFADIINYEVAYYIEALALT